MKLLQSSAAKQSSQLLRSVGRRYFAAAPAPAVASPEELTKRNYANNVAEYNTVVGSLASQRRYYLLRDAYDDMMLDAVQPTRETFQSLLMGTMKGACLQDAIFFRNEMKSMGLVPDVALYNLLISTCGKCKNSDLAIKILEEMKVYEVKPNGQTYITLLNACAAAGRIDRVYAIVRDMTAAGAGLDRFCYAGLITAHKNKIPVTDDTASKIIELVEQSKGWSEGYQNPAQNLVIGLADEELYNMPTAEYIQRRGFLARELTVYHAAFRAFAELRNVEAMEILQEMLKKEGRSPDVFITAEIMKCYLHSGDLDNGLKTFSEHMSSGKLPAIELYVTLIEGAMIGHTARGMQVAQDTLVDMTSRNYFLNPKNASDLLQIAAGEKTGGYTMANYIWDLMRARNMFPTLAAVEAYYKGLKEREIPEDDPRLHAVTKLYNDVRARFGSR